MRQTSGINADRMATRLPRIPCASAWFNPTCRNQSSRFIIIGALRSFSLTPQARQQTNSRTMEVELSAPNGKKWTQPLGLFINNEFVKSSNGQTITSINPTFVSPLRPRPGCRS